MVSLLGRGLDPGMLRAAAWIARCVGRDTAAPLRPADLDALAGYLRQRRIPAGGVLFAAGAPSGSSPRCLGYAGPR